MRHRPRRRRCPKQTPEEKFFIREQCLRHRQRHTQTPAKKVFNSAFEATVAPQAPSRGAKVFWFFFSKKNRLLAS
jgi:hypothetical protein